MPQRFFRPGIRTSERWNSVSRDAQALYVAVLTLVDDYGRYDGRPAVLCGDAFSVWNDKNPRARINPQETAALCCELHKARLIHFYESNGKKCLQMLQWEERIREGAKEKWPECKNINEIDIPQDSAAERSGTLLPSSPPSPSPASAPLPKNGASLSLADIQAVFDGWNKAADKSGLPKCLLVSDKRRRMLEIRLKNDFFRKSWTAAIGRISASKFCLGDSERGWRASFDWLITPDAVVKIMEGKYDDVEKPQPVQQNGF